MKKLLARLKKNSKGFTLVELIIVIAIIAVLAAVIAPQYIQYVDKSRQATDLNALQEIAHAAGVAAVGDGTSSSKLNGSVTVHCLAAGFTYGNTDYDLAPVVPVGSYKFKSTKYTGKDVTITVTNGQAAVGDPANPAKPS